jgi:hypothetical protein
MTDTPRNSQPLGVISPPDYTGVEFHMADQSRCGSPELHHAMISSGEPIYCRRTEGDDLKTTQKFQARYREVQS